MLTSTFYHPRKCQKLCLFLCPYATNRYILAHIKWKSVFGESEHSLPSDNFPPKEIFTQDRNSDVYSVSTIYNIFLCVGVLHCSPKRTKFLTSVHLPNIYTLTQKKKTILRKNQKEFPRKEIVFWCQEKDWRENWAYLKMNYKPHLQFWFFPFCVQIQFSTQKALSLIFDFFFTVKPPFSHHLYLIFLSPFSLILSSKWWRRKKKRFLRF